MFSLLNPLDSIGFMQLIALIDTDDPTLIKQATKLRKDSQLETTRSIYQFMTQNIRYQAERKSQDEWQPPRVTLTKHTGDCEDISGLMASLLTINGIPNWLVLVKNPSWELYHVINGVKFPFSTLMLLDGSIKHPFDQMPFYYQEVNIHGFYSRDYLPTIPFALPIPLSVFHTIINFTP